MAKECNEIGDIVKKCKILLLDIEGTTTSISFVKDKLFPYVEENVKEFLDSQWDTDDVKEAVSSLRKLALEDQENNVEGVIAIPGEDASKEDQIEGLVKNVKWQMSSDRKIGALKHLQGLIWKQGYDKGDIKGHVYDDVSLALEQWRSVDGQKVFIYSSGSVQAQKLLFGQSLSGDLLKYIDGHFDTAVGAKQESASYATIVEKIGCKAEEILFLTDIVKEAEAARSSGLHAALVSREGNAPLPAEATATFPVLQSFTQLTVSNKRKPEEALPQDEQPAKVPKTDTENNVKSNTEEKLKTEIETGPSELLVEKSVQETEKMEVEQTLTAGNENTKEKDSIKDVPMLVETTVEEVTDTKPMCVETTIEEVTDSKEIENIPVSDIQPIITEESVDKTEEKETDKNERLNEPNSMNESEKVIDVNKSEKTTPIVDEPSRPVVTEIQEITNKPCIEEVSEIIENLEPVVEEPPAVEDIEELKNVGDVLEKECDEILSKVQDVTNLDSIPIKPLLNPIAEESMETDNVDSNDIVDTILGTEVDLEIKSCSDIDLNNVKEIGETKKPELIENNEKIPEIIKPVEQIDTIEDKKEPVNKNNVQDEKAENKMEDTKKPIADETKVTDKIEIENSDSLTKSVPTEAEIPAEKKEVENRVEVKGVETKEVEIKETEIKEVNATKEVDSTNEPKLESDMKEPQLNGTNGVAKEVNLNGDASKEEELNSRLSIVNSKEAVNGSNGITEAEQGQGNKAESEVSDIKVKLVATDEPRTDPVEQPTEA